MASGEQTTQSDLMGKINEMIKLQAGIMGKLETVSADMKHLSHRLSMVEKSVESLQSMQGTHAHAQGTSQISEYANQGLAAAVSFNNTLNVMFYGIPSHQCKGDMSLDTLFRNFMFEKLQIEQPRAFSMPIYVQYLPRMSQEDVHPPLCVTFRSSKDRDYVTKHTDRHISSLRKLGIEAKSSYLTGGVMGFWKAN